MTSPPGDDLAGARRRLDDIDDQLIDLLIVRAELVREVASIKRATGRAIHDAPREAELVGRMKRRGADLPQAELGEWIEKLRKLMRRVAGA